MARRPGGKSSRSERRAGRQRAERAREHGLPERREPLPRRELEVEPVARDSAAPAARSSSVPARRGVPLAVKVGAVAVGLLIAAYALSRLRDRASAPSAEDAPAASVGAAAKASSESVTGSEPVASGAEVVTSPAPERPSALAAEPGATAARPTSPRAPTVALPAVLGPTEPVVAKPAPAAKLKVAAPAVPAVPASPSENPYE